MRVIPAIDLLEGNAVRLKKGRRDRATVFSNEPWTLAREFAAAGAERLHVVDLDGAFSGKGAQRAVIDKIIAAAAPVPIQVGGGIRDRATLDAVLAAGAGFAVIGTAAVKDPAFAEAACKAYPGRIVVAVDARHGIVAMEGWVETAHTTASDLGRHAAAWGAAALLYTDVTRDGMKHGPNIEATVELAKKVGAKTPIIASGGVSTLDDLRGLARAGVPFAIVGRALYDKQFTLAEAIAAAR
jgi:phosphoribosylformimino-5-aminoimidazole carboxamide ribotide isomerase